MARKNSNAKKRRAAQKNLLTAKVVKQAANEDGGLTPTPEQMARGYDGGFVMDDNGRQNRAYRKVCILESLYDESRLTQRQYEALVRYRSVANTCYQSEVEDSVGKMLENRMFGGDGAGGMPPSLLRASLELGRLDRELGSLRDIAFAICVQDKSLSEWAGDKFGTVQRQRPAKAEPGDKVVVWLEPRKAALNIAWLDLRMAGERLAAAIAA